MTTDGRFARLERELSPTDAVLDWVAEAHQYTDLHEYTVSTAVRQDGEPPLGGIVGRVETAAYERAKGRPRAEALGAVQAAAEDAMFLFFMVLRLNEAAHEAYKTFELLDVIVSQQHALLYADRRCSTARRRGTPR